MEKNLISAKDFQANYDLAISDYVEKRGGGAFQASYLSWAYAQFLLKTRHPHLSVAFKTSESGDICHRAIRKKESGDIVEIYLLPYLENFEGLKTPPLYFPVMDLAFNALANPSVTEINKAAQRATAKAIAVYTGIGLRLYTNEDIPEPQDKIEKEANHEPIKPPESKIYDRTPEWKKVKIPFGKYQKEGLNIGEIATKDPKYITDYLLVNVEFKSEALKAYLLEARDWIKNGGYNSKTDSRGYGKGRYMGD